MSTAAPSITVERLRATIPAERGVQGRVRVEWLLRSGLVHPPGLPPAAVLVIPQLQQRLPPGHLLGPMPTIASLHGWRRRLQATLAEHLRQSRLPQEGMVPVTAPAVRFVDRGHWLASLARATQSGDAGQRRWWRIAAASEASQAELDRQVLRHIRQLPAAMVRLQQWRLAVAVLDAQSAEVLRRWAAALAGSHACAAAAAIAGGGSASPTRIDRLAGELAGDSADVVDRPVSAPPVAPWLEWAPEATACRSPLAQALFGIALGLHRCPQEVRTSRCAAAMEAWLACARRLAASGAAEAGSLVHRRLSGRAAAATVSDAEEVSAVAEPSPASQKQEWPPQFDEASVPMPVPMDDARSFQSDRAGLAPTTEGQPAEPPPAAEEEVQIHTTAYGGLFFLVNVALAWELYPDFTRPGEPGLRLSLWDWLARTGHDLAGEAMQWDPLWRLLARLAGRDPALPASAIPPPARDWLVDPRRLQELDAASPGSWRHARASGRLRLQHPVGLAVADVADGAGELARLCDGFGVDASRPDGPLPEADDGQRWWRHQLSWLRTRLRRAMGAEAAHRAWYARSARLAVGPDRIDATFVLDAHPIACRLAGLDRDPGWLPTVGYDLFFHFE